MIDDLVHRAAPQLLEPFGIGVDTAAEILVVVGDNPERIKSEAALAKLAGIAPVPTGSGMTSGRHRINHGGHRQLNAAIYRTVIVRMRFHQPTIDYVARRTAEGKTKREIIRCLIGEVLMLRPNPRVVTPSVGVGGRPRCRAALDGQFEFCRPRHAGAPDRRQGHARPRAEQ
ncbi:IS110 family transposase [Streptomyces sp. NBC_01764]|uniref:IS110 family transposase n=1 Tax=Streptomyces sp. NBC_01764 TaxID=2975935 RepID=UPI00224F4191|nr:IS110 family transposase [Streptomyces sp. NBC_01764]MCX4403855.1 IS110 family transposase [Streptomyces sp. NBC_01764]